MARLHGRGSAGGHLSAPGSVPALFLSFLIKSLYKIHLKSITYTIFLKLFNKVPISILLETRTTNGANYETSSGNQIDRKRTNRLGS